MAILVLVATPLADPYDVLAASERPDAYSEWDQSSVFTTTGTAVARVVDQYMNADSNKAETLMVDIYTERNENNPELKVTLTETDVNTGIFEGTIFFTETQVSSGNTLQVMNGDVISVEYTYLQVPGSDKREDLIGVGQEKTITNPQSNKQDTADSDYAPTVSLDRSVYPVPFGQINDFADDIVSTLPDGRSVFPLHKSAIVTGNMRASETLGAGDLTLHIRINDENFDVSSNIDAISEDVAGKTVGPLKISVSRDSQTMVLAYAGGNTPNKNGLIDVDNDDNPNNTRQLGSITEVAPDAAIFELDFIVRYTDGPSNQRCPATVSFTSLNDNTPYGSEESRFDEPSPDKENYCIMNGDIITAEYSYLDESGNVTVVSDSAKFELRNGVLETDKLAYLKGGDLILTLTDLDLDLDTDVAETYSLDLIEWDSSAATLTMGELGGEISSFDPEPRNFRETGDSTGIFQIVVKIPEALEDTALERGEEIILEYTDWGSSGANFVGEEDEDIQATIYSSNFGAIVELDKKTYTWTDKVYITVQSPFHNLDSDIVDEIGATAPYTVQIRSNQSSIDNYKLVETGLNTGIFTGEIALTGFLHDADGNTTTGDDNGNDVVSRAPTGSGPTDGFLPADDDRITVSFEFSEDETVVGSAFIRWNEGKVQWLESSYSATGTGVVMVTDPDMNLNPEKVDTFTIDVWSDADAGGIDLIVAETDEATGIFKGTVLFSTEGESHDNVLRIMGEDNIYAEYDDNTLPEPYTIGDEIDIVGTAMIQKIPPHSPYKQMMSGTLVHEVTCKDELEKIFRPSGFVACVDSSSIKKLLQWGWSLDLIPVDFTGEWRNIDSGTNDIANITITQDGSAVTAQVWSVCDPNSFCDWGESSGTVDSNTAMFSWKVDSVTHEVIITKIGNSLQIDRESVSSDPDWTQNKQMVFIPGILN